MRLLCALLLLLTLALTASAQPGTLDTAFGTDGLLSLGTSDVTTGVDVAPSGRIYVASRFGGDASVRAFAPDGSADLTFGTDGRVTLDLGGDDTALQTVPLADGGVLVFAQSNDEGDESRGGFVFRLSASGMLDTAFGTDGIVRDESLTGAFTGTVDANGRLLVLGSRLVEETPSRSTARAVVQRRNTVTGTLDASFGTDGEVVVDANGENEDGATLASFIELTEDGQIYVAGTLFLPTGSFDGVFFVARMDASGALDPAFAEDGVAITNPDANPAFDQVTSFALDAEERPVLSALLVSFTPASVDARTVLIRFDASGALDDTFGEAGVLGFDTDASGDTFGAVTLVQGPSGRILIGGGLGVITTNQAVPFVGRLLDDGRFDGSFGTEGSLTIDLGLAAAAALIRVASETRGLALIIGDLDNEPTENRPVTLAAFTLGTDTATDPASGARGLELRLAGPNPFSGQTAVLVETDRPREVRVTLVDLLGREVAQVHAGPLAAGEHRLAIPAGPLAPGTYVVRVTASDTQQSLRLVRL